MGVLLGRLSHECALKIGGWRAGALEDVVDEERRGQTVVLLHSSRTSDSSATAGITASSLFEAFLLHWPVVIFALIIVIHIDVRVRMLVFVGMMVVQLV